MTKSTYTTPRKRSILSRTVHIMVGTKVGLVDYKVDRINLELTRAGVRALSPISTLQNKVSKRFGLVNVHWMVPVTICCSQDINSCDSC